MRSQKKTKFISLGRKWFFTLALFLLVFAAASILKIQAASNITGHLWGGSEDKTIGGTFDCFSEPGCIDGNETGVGWISMSGTAQDGTLYGVNIPADSCSGMGCAVTGYAWANAGGNPDNGFQNGIGSIDFDPQNHCGITYSAASCSAPDSSGMDATKGGVKRVGNNLVGWARIVEIAKATVAPSNSGGWSGWIKMKGTAQDGTPYGVDITKMKGNERTPTDATYAWSGSNIAGQVGELGWIDFSRAKYTPPPPPPECVTGMSTCSGHPIESCDKDTDCKDSIACTVTSDYSWTCSNGNVAEDKICPAIVDVPDFGECGVAASMNFCGESSAPTNPTELCNKGTASSVTPGYSEYTWTCGSTKCDGIPASCSAPGIHCGWMETSP